MKKIIKVGVFVILLCILYLILIKMFPIFDLGLQYDKYKMNQIALQFNTKLLNYYHQINTGIPFGRTIDSLYGKYTTSLNLDEFKLKMKEFPELNIYEQGYSPYGSELPYENCDPLVELNMGYEKIISIGGRAGYAMKNGKIDYMNIQYKYQEGECPLNLVWMGKVSNLGNKYLRIYYLGKNARNERWEIDGQPIDDNVILIVYDRLH